MSADVFVSKTFCTVPSLNARCTGDVGETGILLCPVGTSYVDPTFADVKKAEDIFFVY